MCERQTGQYVQGNRSVLFNVLRILEHLLAVAERSVANPVRITTFEVRAKCLLDIRRSTGYKLQLDDFQVQVRPVTAMLTFFIPKTQTKSARLPIIQSAIDLRVEEEGGR